MSATESHTACIFGVKRFVFGVVVPKPWKDEKLQIVRVAMSATEFARVYVKIAGAVVGYYIEEKDGCWLPSRLVAEGEI